MLIDTHCHLDFPELAADLEGILNRARAAKVQQMIDSGKTEQEVLAAKVTAPYDAKVQGGLQPAGAAGTSADRFVAMVYAELNGGK